MDIIKRNVIEINQGFNKIHWSTFPVDWWNTVGKVNSCWQSVNPFLNRHSLENSLPFLCKPFNFSNNLHQAFNSSHQYQMEKFPELHWSILHVSTRANVWILGKTWKDWLEFAVETIYGLHFSSASLFKVKREKLAENRQTRIFSSCKERLSISSHHSLMIAVTGRANMASGWILIKLLLIISDSFLFQFVQLWQRLSMNLWFLKPEICDHIL